MHRIEERLEGISISEINSYFFSTFKKPKIIKEFKGRTLIEFSAFNNKVGYFVAEVIDGAVFIRTFLFLTNDGTPEGEKLKELAGLSRTGKKYFKIDTMSTFINSDIEKDETLKEIFIKAGCESLFKIISSESKDPTKGKKTASALLEYLKKN